MVVIANAKRVSVAELDRLRVEAVRLRLQKVPLKTISAQTGLTSPTILAAYKCFLAGGWAAVRTAARGRPQGSRRALPVADATFLEALTAAKPSQTAGAEALWSLPLLRQWANSEFSLALTERTLLRYTERWGLNPAQAVLDPAVVLVRTGETWAQLVQRARQSGRVVLTGGINRVRPGGEGAASGGLGQSIGQVYVRDGRGKLYWLHEPGAVTSALLQDFFQRLLAWHPAGVVLLFKSYDLARLPELQAWLTAHQDRFEWVSLSGAEELLTNRRAPEAGCDRPITRGQSRRNPESSQLQLRNPMSLTHLQRLEAESMQIMREVVAETENPVMLYSIGKDSAVMLHLAMKAFYPSVPPFPLLHVDTTWKFQDMYRFRDKMVKECGMELLTYTNPEGLEQGINPFTHGSAIHTDIMKTEALKQALNKYGFDAAFGGARRDEEKSRAKERIFSFRSAEHRWDPKAQRPEVWKHYNSRKHKGESIRVFPLSNWTELDIWQYIHLENVPIVPLYYSAERPVVERDGMLIMVDDERMPLNPGEVPMLKKVRFRTLGCYPLTGAVVSEADTLPAIIQEMLLTKTSERQGRMIDHDSAASMEKKKQEGYF